MASTVQTIKSEFLKGVVAAVFGVMGFLLASLGADILSAVQSSPLPAISRTVQSKLLVLLAIALLLTFVLMLHYRRKSHVTPPSGGYTFTPDPGYYVHKKTGGHFCNPCLAKGIASRLSIHHIDGLKCRVCGEVYIDPQSEQAAFAAYAAEHKNS